MTKCDKEDCFFKYKDTPLGLKLCYNCKFNQEDYRADNYELGKKLREKLKELDEIMKKDGKR